MYTFSLTFKYDPSNIYRLLTVYSVKKGSTNLNLLISKTSSKIMVIRNWYDCKIVIGNLALQTNSIYYPVNTSSISPLNIDLIKEFNLVTTDDNYFTNVFSSLNTQIIFSIKTAYITLNSNGTKSLLTNTNYISSGISLLNYKLIITPKSGFNDSVAYLLELTVNLKSGLNANTAEFNLEECSNDKIFIISVVPEKTITLTNKLSNVTNMDLIYLNYERMGKIYSNANAIILNDTINFGATNTKNFSFDQNINKNSLKLIDITNKITITLTLANNIYSGASPLIINIQADVINNFVPSNTSNQAIFASSYLSELFKVQIYELNLPREYYFYIRAKYIPKKKLKIIGPNVGSTDYYSNIGYSYDLKSIIYLLKNSIRIINKGMIISQRRYINFYFFT